LRILIVNAHGRVTGGADTHCFELDRLLRERGHEVEFLATAHPENLISAGAFIPQTVNRGSRDSLDPGAAARVARAACWNATAAAATERVLDDFQPDLVHAHKLYPQLSVAPVVVAAGRSVPIVQTAHDYEFVSASAFDDSGSSRDREEERLSYRSLNSLLFQVKRRLHAPRVSRWIAVSRDLAGVYERQGGIEAETIPNFVLPAEPSAPPAERTGALFVGRLAAEKGLDQVIELARRRPRLAVRIAGLGPLASMAREAAEAIPNLSFMGPLDSAAVQRAMRSARVILMPAAWREPGPLVTLEAMRAGTPIVAYDRGGLAEYIRDAGAGLVREPDVEGLTDAVDTVLGDPDLWQRLSEAGVRAARTTHSPAAYLDRLEAIYRECSRAGQPVGVAS
jgi:glycosyltransferase involved in cell wall biosynthesis